MQEDFKRASTIQTTIGNIGNFTRKILNSKPKESIDKNYDTYLATFNKILFNKSVSSNLRNLYLYDMPHLGIISAVPFVGQAFELLTSFVSFTRFITDPIFLSQECGEIIINLALISRELSLTKETLHIFDESSPEYKDLFETRKELVNKIEDFTLDIISGMLTSDKIRKLSIFASEWLDIRMGMTSSPTLAHDNSEWIEKTKRPTEDGTFDDDKDLRGCVTDIRKTIINYGESSNKPYNLSSIKNFLKNQEGMNASCSLQEKVLLYAIIANSIKNSPFTAFLSSVTINTEKLISSIKNRFLFLLPSYIQLISANQRYTTIALRNQINDAYKPALEEINKGEEITMDEVSKEIGEGEQVNETTIGGNRTKKFKRGRIKNRRHN